MIRGADYVRTVTAILLDSFARSKRAAGCVPNTIDSYLNDARFLVAHLAATGATLASATRRDIEAFMSDQVEAGKAPATIAHRYRSFVQLFRWLEEEDELDGPNPMTKMREPIVPENPPAIVTTAIFRQLLATAGAVHRSSNQRTVFENRRDPALLRMLWSSGIRAGEIIGLAIADVDLRSEEFTVLGKGRKPRTVSLLPATADAIDRYLRVRSKHKHAQLPWLWLSTKGRLTTSGLRQMLDRRCVEIGVEPINPHRFRHTFAHEAKVRGMSDDALMEVAGWTTPQMLRRYGKSAAAQRARESHRKLFGEDG
jgi:site-specific recombinase XerD